MSKSRVYELAKEYNVTSKDLIELLKEFNINIKNHMSIVEDEGLKIIKDYYGVKEEANKDATKNTNTAKKEEVLPQSDIDADIDDIEDVIAVPKGKIKDAGPKKVVNNKVKPKKKGFDKSAAEKSNEKQESHQELKIVSIKDGITVKELAEKLKKPSAEIIKKLILSGVMATINHELDFAAAEKIAEQYGIIAEQEQVKNLEEVLINDIEDNPEDLRFRPPVVTIMGHVDHGKTSLLDAIRETHVTLEEAGGITQHIGAYTVEINDNKITFLDTPGHEAFTSMRMRGAQATDIAILVVAADDGVMPQTIEAINHAKAANVPIVVAVNKIDKPNANPDKVKQELTEYGLVSEDWGGDTIIVHVSAKTKEGISTLLEMILLVAEMQELKANPNRYAKGIVIESKLDKSRGAVATILVKNGTLHIGDAIVAGTSSGRVRAMFDDKGKKVKGAGPSIPVEVLGFNEAPDSGDIMYVVQDEKVARQIVEGRVNETRSKMIDEHKVSLEGLFSQIEAGKVKDLNIIVKADVHGSVEALTQSLERLSNEKVKVKVIHGGVGAITETDVTFASVSNAVIIGFNVRPDIKASVYAEKEKVDIKTYRIIYEAIGDIESAMKGMLDPEFKEVVQGRAEVRATFKVSSIGTIAGCYVTEGKINRANEVRLIRDGVVIYEGKLASLKRFKDDAKEVSAGYECGISVEKFNDIKEGDIFESFEMVQIDKAK
ncbi:translation initiation factor IF-2 [Oxobacter pfennigii]|uniref:Translation initiation factor IF-2 n=1 Tax=Oxobacter pfennigii TaxID=36849 RepID=A0A0P8WMZ9_9CLOT|nr:translation initiation factor IF-2 [Oxobacter pfennigii]KPU43902.1 translation initiation factor IF-2 [Oxobacter pfennigii]